MLGYMKTPPSYNLNYKTHKCGAITFHNSQSDSSSKHTCNTFLIYCTSGAICILIFNHVTTFL